MKVLVLSHLFPRPSSPWSGVFVAEQVAALRNEGIDARVLWGQGVGMPLARPKPPSVWATNGNVPNSSFAYRVPHRLWRFLAAQAYRAAALRACDALSGQFAFDLIHAHTAWLDGYAAVAIGRLHRKPVVLTEHSGPFSTQVENPLRRSATAQALKGAEAIFAVSAFLRSQMQAAFPDLSPGRIDVIGNGVDEGTFALAPGRAAEEPLRAAWIGAFVPIKQPLMMLRAFSRATEGMQVGLDLVGIGPLEQAMRAEVETLGLGQRVTWHGSLPRQQVAECLAAADFLIVSSRAETFCVAALEALATGCPVISTRCGGPEEIVDEPDLGLIVDNNEDALAHGIAEMAQRCRSFDRTRLSRSASDRFAYPVLARRLVKTYQHLLSREAT